jgi:DNA-binding response OmpR family regulator
MMLTSLPNGLDIIAVSETGAVVEDYVGKPIRPVELLQRVEKLLALRSTQPGQVTLDFPNN